MHLITRLCRSCWTVIVLLQLRDCLFCTEYHLAAQASMMDIKVELPVGQGDGGMQRRSWGLRYLRGWVCILHCSARTRRLIEGRGGRRRLPGVCDNRRGWLTGHGPCFVGFVVLIIEWRKRCCGCSSWLEVGDLLDCGGIRWNCTVGLKKPCSRCPAMLRSGAVTVRRNL